MATMASAAATTAAAARDIPQTSSAGRDNLTAVAAARSVPVTRTHPLPTPPNSISPSLPPHGLKAQLQKARLDPIDSDLDLHEGADSNSVGSSYESAGDITPVLLAKFHLPDILLNHGPLAIRHIMGYLTTSVPGFAGIPPPKARRLVVAALEGRGQGQGHGVEGGGMDGDVEFEKVGWGRWDAKRRGQPARHATSRPSAEDNSGPYPTSIPISKAAGRTIERPRLNVRATSNSISASFSHDDRDMLENEADKMSLDSLDGPASASCSEAPDEDMIMNDDPDDATDDEDWAAVGAAALRAASYSSPAEARQGSQYFSSHVYNSGGFRSFSGTGMLREPRLDNIDLDALAASSDAQEREAIQALLQLGSV